MAAVVGVLIGAQYQYALANQFQWFGSIQVVALVIIVIGGTPWYALYGGLRSRVGLGLRDLTQRRQLVEYRIRSRSHRLRLRMLIKDARRSPSGCATSPFVSTSAWRQSGHGSRQRFPHL